MSIKMEVWGEYACFTRPEMKVERVSYDVPTPSAARGMVESVYYHPGLKWHVDKIYVCKPIRFTNILRNEVASKISARNVLTEANGKKRSYIDRNADIQQRATTMLRDVHYVIEAHFEMTDKANPSDNPGKFQDIVKRRLRSGQAYMQPYLGCRECTAHFRLWEGGDIPTIDETRDLGYMLYDMEYSDPENIQPMFFRAQMVHGVIDLTDCEVVK
ncbi:MAG: type I-C CRISPR-associated protein Cas5c [Christensenellales bacterium]|jgi:CRISPR-associated protein Cas5d|nr:type I-C CRISPR-associated protein Cas5 [Clostridiales bacterium]MEE0851674.1 type I-C CRISPR-associated protein Cas5c [Christensenellales bacterium]